LKDFCCRIDIYDPIARCEEVKEEYGIEMIKSIEKQYDAVIIAVAHNEFKDMDIISMKKNNGIIYDIKGLFPKEMSDGHL
jgi:UDP-N-acetyl-D-galactosamine dehydrogenase